jgi:hypothetical protein
MEVYSLDAASLHSTPHSPHQAAERESKIQQLQFRLTSLKEEISQLRLVNPVRFQSVSLQRILNAYQYLIILYFVVSERVSGREAEIDTIPLPVRSFHCSTIAGSVIE